MINHQSNELFSRDSPKYDSTIPNSVQIELEREKDRNRGLFLEVMENLHNIEVASPFLGDSFLSVDYAYQMSVLSNLVYTEIRSKISLNLTPLSAVQTKLLPSVAQLVDLIILASQSLVNISIQPENPSLSKSCIYRYFFFNFLISAALPDILLLTRADSQSHRILHQEILKTLAHILHQVSDKRVNELIDQEILS